MTYTKSMITKFFTKELNAHENKWVALRNNKIIAEGRNILEVKKRAEKKGFKNFSFYLVPSSSVRFAGL